MAVPDVASSAEASAAEFAHLDDFAAVGDYALVLFAVGRFVVDVNVLEGAGGGGGGGF